MWQYLEGKKLISENQWGFCPAKSTTTALLSTFHEVIEQGSDVALIFFDLRKAFDSVPHALLLKDIKLDSHIV